MTVKFTDRFEKALRKKGWRPDRKFDVSDGVNLLAAEGFEVFPLASKYIENLNKLELKNPELQFELSCGLGMFDDLAYWMEINSVRLYILGFYNSHGREIYIGSDGKLYAGDWAAIYRVGDTISDGLDALYFQDRPHMILVSPTWEDEKTMKKGAT